MAKKFLFRGKEEEDLKKLSISEFAELIDSRLRRKVKRGFTEVEKKLIERVEKREQNIKVQCRDMIILPSMIGLTMKIHNGKEWNPITVIPDMLGHRFGEFSMTRKSVRHSAAGIGATKSSSSMSVK